MTPVLQTEFGPRGNCMSACIASILEIPLESVPNFYEAGPSESHWHHALHTWLEELGLALVPCSVKASGGDIFLRGIRGYAIASGPSPRVPGVWHAVVFKDGQVVHDPMGPAAAPLEEIEEIEFLRPLDPARQPTSQLAIAELVRLRALIDSPETGDFDRGVQLECAHQVERWGEAHDRSKSSENWFWLVGYLAGKALRASILGDRQKALHHTISAAAALRNWHKAIKRDTSGAGIGHDEDLEALTPP